LAPRLFIDSSFVSPNDHNEHHPLSIKQAIHSEMIPSDRKNNSRNVIYLQEAGAMNRRDQCPSLFIFKKRIKNSYK
jgi:hypothetical protein